MCYNSLRYKAVEPKEISPNQAILLVTQKFYFFLHFNISEIGICIIISGILALCHFFFLAVIFPS